VEHIGEDLDLHAKKRKLLRACRRTVSGWPDPGAVPNLIKGLEPSGVNEIWVNDITYIATLEGWLYLAIVLDLFSRKVVGWKVGETLEAELVVSALENALMMRTPDRGLYFHSDRGSQYSQSGGAQTLERDRSQFKYECPGKLLR
jgi:putative transposase